MPLLLRPPTAEDEPALRAMHAQLADEDFDFLMSDAPWPEFLARIEQLARGVDLPPDRVPADWLVAEVDGVPVGRVSIRHQLNDFLLDFGGHVGYAVAPQFRGRGYATRILREAVARLAARGADRVLVTCDPENTASARTIERCGGVLEDIREAQGRRVSRYWIATQPAPCSTLRGCRCANTPQGS